MVKLLRMHIFWQVWACGLFVFFATAGSMKSAFAQVQVQISPQEGTLDDVFQFKIQTRGEEIKKIEFPDIQGLQIHGPSKSENKMMINGKFYSDVSWIYSLIPQKIGSFVIPPLKVFLDGKTVETDAMHFEVRSKPDPLKSGLTPPYFVKRILSTETPYVFQPVKATYRLYYRQSIKDVSVSEISSPDIRKWDFSNQSHFKENINGFEYRVLQFHQTLIPTKTGEVELGPTRMEAVISAPQRRSRSFFPNPFAQYEKKALTGVPQSLQVRPLPPFAPSQKEKSSQKPFFSGLVGEFLLEGSLSAENAQVGDTLTLTLAVDGRGSLAGMKPWSPSVPPGFKVYDDKPENSETTTPEGDLQSRRVMRWALIPTQAGTYSFDPLTLWVFNPNAKGDGEGDYQKLTVFLRDVQVTAKKGQPQAFPPSQDPESQKTQQAQVPQEKREIDPSKKIPLPKEETKPALHGPVLRVDLEKSDQLTPQDHVKLGLIVGVPGLLFLGLCFLSFKKSPPSFWRRYKKKKQPLKNLKRDLNLISQQGSGKDMASFILGAVRSYFSEKIQNQNEPSIHDAWSLERFLSKTTMDPGDQKNMFEEFESLEKVCYGPDINLDSQKIINSGNILLRTLAKWDRRL